MGDDSVASIGRHAPGSPLAAALKSRDAEALTLA
jgi:hypothetical protein